MNTLAPSLMEQCGAYLLGEELPELTSRRLAGPLIDRYNEPWRRYHTIPHLKDMVGFLVEIVDELEQPRPTFWATLGHDGIYLPRNPQGMNERLSGALTSGLVMPYLSAQEVQRIDRHINATANHVWDGKDMDLAYFLDADMKILGAEPEEFDKYDDNIRLEYDMYDDETYRQGRIHVLREFARKPRLFITDIAHERYGDQTKANLERKIGELAAA